MGVRRRGSVAQLAAARLTSLAGAGSTGRPEFEQASEWLSDNERVVAKRGSAGTCPRHSAGQSAPVAPPERPGEAAEDSPFTETWEFRAMVAEAGIAALVQSMPRIIVAALTGNTS
jgi:hypothetical protein